LRAIEKEEAWITYTVSRDVFHLYSGMGCFSPIQ